MKEKNEIKKRYKIGKFTVHEGKYPESLWIEVDGKTLNVTKYDRINFSVYSGNVDVELGLPKKTKLTRRRF